MDLEVVKSVSKVEKKSKMENAYNQIAKQVVKKYYNKRINILFNETLLKKQIEQVGDSYKCIPCQRTFKNKATKINRNNRDHWYCCKYCKNIEQDRLKEIHREKLKKKSKMENAYNQIAKQRINTLFNEALLKKQIEQVGDSYKCIPCQRTFKNKATKINRNNRDRWYCCKYCKNIEQDRLKEIHREKFFRNSYITVANDSEDIKLANDSNCVIDSESKLTV